MSPGMKPPVSEFLDAEVERLRREYADLQRLRREVRSIEQGQRHAECRMRPTIIRKLSAPMAASNAHEGTKV
jgi:hypothetical protein